MFESCRPDIRKPRKQQCLRGFLLFRGSFVRDKRERPAGQHEPAITNTASGNRSRRFHLD